MKMTHMNHASVLVESNAEFLLTDPWYISPAFGGWVHNPPPFTEMVRNLLSLPQDSLRVVISHGHDDHVDNFFVSKHLRNAKFFVPKFKTNGLSRRIESLTGTYPTELTETPVVSGCYTLASYINEEFTLYDSIIVIEGPRGCLIHANDNWHKYSPSLIGKLRNAISKYDPKDVFFMTQFGIADCFPMNYLGYSQAEYMNIIKSRMASYAAATTANLEGLGLKKGYYYANQTGYNYPSCYSGAPLYDLAQQYVASHELPFSQLTPGTGLNYTATQKYDHSIFRSCLSFLESFVQKKIGGDQKIKLVLSGDELDPTAVSYQTERAVWQRIFIGELTLEAVTVGGLGLISKPKTVNISRIHHELSKLSYLIQANILKNGIHFFLGES
jgi:hypothetical protein